MKKLRIYLLLLSIFISISIVSAKGVFSDLDNINTIQCSGTFINGSINEYSDTKDYKYILKNGNIYSSNLNDLYGDLTKAPKKVLRLKISDNYITFKERLIKFEAIYCKWVKIDRNTGEYTFNAKNDYGFFYKRANVKGTCIIGN